MDICCYTTHTRARAHNTHALTHTRTHARKHTYTHLVQVWFLCHLSSSPNLGNVAGHFRKVVGAVGAGEEGDEEVAKFHEIALRVTLEVRHKRVE